MSQIVANITIPQADELSIIKYLIEEIEEEKAYNEAHKKELDRAINKAKAEGGSWWNYFNNEAFPHEPRKSVIKDNLKMIRRLALKINIKI